MANDPAEPRTGMPVGLMVAGSEMAGFTVAGLLLDYWLGTMPWVTVALTVLGSTAAFLHLSQWVKKRQAPPGTGR